MWKHAPRLAALAIALCATACAGSSVPQPEKSPELAAAIQALHKRLDCPPPPPALTHCQDGTLPSMAVKDGVPRYVCPMPQALEAAVSQAPYKDIAAQAGGWALKEVDLRFKALEWLKPCWEEYPTAPTPAAGAPKP